MKKEGNTLGLKYDLGSILHYGEYVFQSKRNPFKCVKSYV